MRPTTKALIVFGLLALLPGVADGQAMVEHALSAAGGSAAGVAGKAVSNGIDSVLRKVNQVTGLAAQTGTLAPARMPAAGVAPAGAVATTADKTTCPRAGKPAPQPEPSLAMPIPSPPPEPAEPVPSTAAEIARIEAGASRQDVLARLGKPSARITIPDGDRLVEIYQYAAKGERLGSLRFTDGLVSR